MFSKEEDANIKNVIASLKTNTAAFDTFSGEEVREHALSRQSSIALPACMHVNV